MSVRTRSVTTENGDYLRVIEWVDEHREYASVVCEYPVDDPERFIVRGHRNADDDEAAFQDVFEMRELSFTPISIAGLGERERLTGVSQADKGRDYDEIPRDICRALNSLGFAVVPQGEGWLDGV